MAEQKAVIPPWRPPYDSVYIGRILAEKVDDILYGSCCSFNMEPVGETKEYFDFDIILKPLEGRLPAVYMRKLCNFFYQHFPATDLRYIQPESGCLRLRIRVERSERTHESIVVVKRMA